MTDLLKKELETYQAHKSELVSKWKGKYVLIKDDQIVDVFDTQRDAINYGYRTLGVVAFLVKQIKEVDTPEWILTIF